MAAHFQKFNNWVRQHKLFALATPLVLLLLIYFVTNSISGMEILSREGQTKSGYDNSLPNQAKELIVKDPNSYYKSSLKDSLEAIQNKGTIQNIVVREKETDSLEKILEDLDNFSIDENQINTLPENNSTASNQGPTIQTDNKSVELSETEKKLQYIQMLQNAREERIARNQEYSESRNNIQSEKVLIPTVKVRASVYRNQFIIPGQRVTLLLMENLHYMDNVFPKNTLVYATANIKGSRVLLNINKILDTPIKLMVRDLEDNELGIHNDTAGDLINEFYEDLEMNSVNDVSDEISKNIEIPLTQNAISAFGNFFSNKKRKNRDEIPLLNGYKVNLVNE